MRRLRSFLGHSGGETAWRVVVVDQADDLNINAANALLKSLEEPPPRTIFLLLSSQPGRLLPTIRSRCRTLDLAPLPLEALRKATEQALTAAEQEPASACAMAGAGAARQGSVAAPLRLSTGGGIALYERIVKSVASLPGRLAVVAHAGRRVGREPPTSSASSSIFELLLDLLTRLIVRQATGRAPERRCDSPIV